MLDVSNGKITSKIPPLSDATLARFLSYCDRRRFPKRGIVFRETDRARSLYYILDGTVAVTSVDEDGEETILSYLHKGEFIGELGLFTHKLERSAMVRARTDCSIAEISYEYFEQLVKKELKDHYAEILGVVGFQLSERLLKSSKRISQLSSMDVSGRIESTLLDLCHEPHALSHPQGTQIHISRQELARIVSCSRETVGRVLKQMNEDGIINVKGMEIVVYHER